MTEFGFEDSPSEEETQLSSRLSLTYQEISRLEEESDHNNRRVMRGFIGGFGLTVSLVVLANTILKDLTSGEVWLPGAVMIGSSQLCLIRNMFRSQQMFERILNMRMQASPLAARLHLLQEEGLLEAIEQARNLAE